MDEVDRKILFILEKNSRTPYLKIAKKIGMSEGTVRRRVNRLIRNGSIRRFTIITAPMQKLRAFVLVDTVPKVPVPEVSEKIQQVVRVKEVYEVSGEYNILAFVEGENIKEINNTVDEIRTIEGVARTITIFVLR